MTIEQCACIPELGHHFFVTQMHPILQTLASNP
jgi:hypothetical protein